MEGKSLFKYLVSSERDLQWGLIVDNVGQAEVLKNYETYPPDVGHPEDYRFNPQKGRILDNYQLVYISKGKGEFFVSQTECLTIHAGDMLIIPPYTWHSYLPDKRIGWQEYWIGMRGPNMDQRFKHGFFSAKKRVYKVGLREDIVSLYNQAIDIALSEQPTHQQSLAGIGHLILGLAIYYDHNQNFVKDVTVKQIDMARVIMRENCLTKMSPYEVAEQVNMGYSWFRKRFKEYTSVSPAHFMLELKLNKAKSQILNSSLSIKDIAYMVGYEDVAYFIAVFKKYTGFTPLAYRQQYSSAGQTD